MARPDGFPRARALMGPYALVYLYRRRLRAHAAQELLAGLGVAIAVALVFAATVASASVAASAAQVVHAVIGPATLQLRARGDGGIDEGLLARVEHLPGVRQAAPLLEQSATITVAGGRHVGVDLAGADIALLTLDGLAHTLPTAALSPTGIGLSTTTAHALKAGLRAPVSLALDGAARPLRVDAVLGRESFGALSQARVAVMPLADLQRLAGLRGRVTRILVAVRPGRTAQVRRELLAIAGGRVEVASADQDLALLSQALRPSDQASALFAAISALLGFLFAFNALLLTAPERRQAIADLRLNGVRPSAIVQMVAFQALCLGIAACALGLAGGYALSQDVFHQSTAYLAEAFTLGSHTVVGAGPLAWSLGGGLAATCLASIVPLTDLRNRSGALDSVYRDGDVPGNALGHDSQLRLAILAGVLVVAGGAIFALAPTQALLACVALALATVLAVPVIFAGVLRAARALTEHRGRLTILPVALTSLQSTTLRCLALAATGALALFGAVALGGAREDLLRGIGGFAHSYAADADVWVTNPGDNQATAELRPADDPARIASVAGVSSVQSFQGTFMNLDGRRVWVIARPPGGDRHLLASQILQGDLARANARLAHGGWIAVSQQIATEHHVGVGGVLSLPTPTGPARLRIAATTTNLAWSPGAIFIDSADFTRLWASSLPSALGVTLRPGVSATAAASAIKRALRPDSGLQVSTSQALQARIDTLTGEGLGQLAEIATLLLCAAILAMAAALSSAIWQRRISLAGLRLSGASCRRLRLILATEAGLMLGAGCVTGALAGILGEVVIDSYLRHITGFPVAALDASWRPLELLAIVLVAVAAIVALPGWLAASVSPTLALGE